MQSLCRFLLFLPMASVTLLAQLPLSRNIQAIGNATISVNPDQAQLDVGVVTQATTAQDAAAQNATQSTAVLNALKAVLGTGGAIQTISYSVTPRYSTGQSPVIIGYTATNTVEVTTTSTDPALLGRLIDSANQAGANSVSGLRFGLQDSEPVKRQALTQAAKQARAHADAIAAGLGAKTGLVLSAEEGATTTPLVAGVGATATPTPIVTGTVSVSASVTISVQLIQ
jgi:uncharacterized protein YggE